MAVNIKRIYDQTEQKDGIRVLVDRVWPRGISKDDAQLDYWLKELGPSTDLRKWFGHDPDRYDVFKQKYKAELEKGQQQEALQKLKDLTRKHNKQLTLLFSAKDEQHNQARVLKEILDTQ
ncbi:Uncharacterized conserved protein YeaO, DUF488 family [Lentibacillus halodurans]|uniref:Uncharacterized conserved protein YeaO, DUF488 family n=1 Tax=Lentibacillus halodurans TaxID=237679 RepID=A0A1I0X8U0_9BACI|nr:DUF488 domain-containing protein [Lentibacillus halodurans]SFA97452.1 Uncharacterized conserved protein YeaO, DUF488 family [Lentibacillus halodurans]